MQLTIAEATAMTAKLISECPAWCTVDHDSTTHPQDIFHRRDLSDENVGRVFVDSWPSNFPGMAQVSISIPERGADFTRDDAMALASAFLRLCEQQMSCWHERRAGDRC